MLFEKKECNLNVLNYFSIFEKMSLKCNRGNKRLNIISDSESFFTIRICNTKKPC